jgi:hypothetical protein
MPHGNRVTSMGKHLHARLGRMDTYHATPAFLLHHDSFMDIVSQLAIWRRLNKTDSRLAFIPSNLVFLIRVAWLARLVSAPMLSTHIQGQWVIWSWHRRIRGEQKSDKTPRRQLMEHGCNTAFWPLRVCQAGHYSLHRHRQPPLVIDP